jgi:hypothetical protein
MATSLSLENDSSLAQGYLKVNGSTAATLTTSGITGNLTGNADTATKFSTTTGSAPAYACRAWVNFDGTRDSSGAVSSANTNRFIRSSGNVTSVLRNAAGNYTVNFTTPMSNANYCQIVTGGNTNNTENLAMVGNATANPNYTTASTRVIFDNAGGTLHDVTYGNVAIFGN